MEADFSGGHAYRGSIGPPETGARTMICRIGRGCAAAGAGLPSWLPVLGAWALVAAGTAGAARGEVTTVEWAPGSPPRWSEKTISSPHRVAIEIPPPPPGHEFLTVVIETADGQRVRNLLSQAPLGPLVAGAPAGKPLTVVWDGMNDAGEVVAAGTYQARGLSLPRPRILYDYSFYMPNPLPWQGYPHSGWAADHTGPGDVACAPAGGSTRTAVAIACGVAENPHAVLGLDESHRKIWGYKREGGINGINAIDHADGVLWMAFKETIVKVDADSRQDVGWKRPAGRAAALAMPGLVTRIAVGPELGAALVRKAAGPDHGENLPADTLVLFDKESGTARNRRTFPLELPLPEQAFDVVYLADGRLLVSGEQGVSAVAKDGAVSAVSLPDCRSPRQRAADEAGNLFVFDEGPDWQVKVYGPDLKLVRSIGRRGGQKVHRWVAFTEVEAADASWLAVDFGGFRRVGGMDVDARGRLWVAEPLHPRMITVWDGEGKQVERFVGNTEYGAAGCSLHEQDPTRGFGYGLIFSISPDKTVPHEPVRFASSLRLPEPAEQRLPRIGQGHYFKSGRLFRTAASGTMREYLVHNHFGYPVLCIERDGDYRPCAAAVVVAGGDVPSQFAKADCKPGRGMRWYGVWSDANGDELVQPEEVHALPEAGGRNEDFYGMGYVFNPQLTWYLGGFAVEPSGFRDDGTPLFEAAGIRKLEGTGLAVRAGDYLVGDVSGVFQTGQYRFADLAGRVHATYPLHAVGVHGSQRASAPRAGETRGELCYAGATTVPGALGPVVATQGNMGQMFVFTGDGLFVCSLFKDTRQGPSPWPSEAPRGVDFSDCTMGQEPFVGCLVAQDDGAVRVLFGRTAANVCRVEGLADARRFGPVPVSFDPAAAAPAGVAAAAGAARVAAAERRPDAAPPLRIPRLAADAIRIDGDLGDWPAGPQRTIRAGEKSLALVRLACAGDNLLVGVRVRDETPLVNGLADWRSAFRTGDAVDLYFGPARDAAAKPVSSEPVAGDLRILLVPAAAGPLAIRYRPVVPGADGGKRVPFESPGGTTAFDEVEKLPQAEVVFTKTAGGYVCEAAIPLEAASLAAEPGKTYAGDVGVLSSDGGGQQTVARNYLFNRTWTMTADLCSEAMLQPDTWGTVVFE